MAAHGPVTTEGTSGVARSIVALATGELANKVARFAAAVVLARTLSLADFGAVNVGIALAGIGLMATSLGLPEVGSRDIAAHPAELKAVAARVLAGRLLALLTLMAIGIGIVAATTPDALVLALLVAAMAVGMAVSGDWALRGLGRMATLASATAAGGIAVLAGVLLVLPAAPSRDLAIALFAAGELLVAALTWRALGVLPIPRLRRSGLPALLRRSWPAGASALIVYSYYANLDTILLAGFRSDEEAGLYGAPYRIFLALNVLGTFAAYALLPVMTRLVVAGRQQVANDELRRRLAPLLCYGLVVLGAVELAGARLLEALFGSEFGEMRATLIILCSTIPWYSVAFPCGYTRLAHEQGRRFLAGAAVAGTLNLLLNLGLIPLFGAEGAAVATLIALVAGSAAWLHAARVLDHDGIRLLLVLALSLATGIVAAGSATAAPWMGALLLMGGAVGGIAEWRRMAGRRDDGA